VAVDFDCSAVAESVDMWSCRAKRDWGVPASFWGAPAASALMDGLGCDPAARGEHGIEMNKRTKLWVDNLLQKIKQWPQNRSICLRQGMTWSLEYGLLKRITN
jgi:hypothetical protein